MRRKSRVVKWSEAFLRSAQVKTLSAQIVRRREERTDDAVLGTPVDVFPRKVVEEGGLHKGKCFWSEAR